MNPKRGVGLIIIIEKVVVKVYCKLKTAERRDSRSWLFLVKFALGKRETAIFELQTKIITPPLDSAHLVTEIS